MAADALAGAEAEDRGAEQQPTHRARARSGPKHACKASADKVKSGDPAGPGAHVVEAERIAARFPRQRGAYALLERLGEINRARLLPVIERVLNSFDRAGEVIRIDRLDVDLGRVREGDLATLEARLEAALRDALRKAMPPRQRAENGAAGGETGGNAEAGEPGGATATAAAVPLLASRLDSLEHVLLHGTWPYGASVGRDVSPPDLLADLLDRAPARAHRHAAPPRPVRAAAAPPRPPGARGPAPAPAAPARPAKRRLDPRVHGRDEGGARRRADRRRNPRKFRPHLVDDRASRRLHRAGLRANRRAFVARLVADLAASAGLSFEALVAQLRSAMLALPAARGDASLVSILAEIGRESAGDTANAAAFAALAAWLSGEGPGPDMQDEAASGRLLDEAGEAGRHLLRRLAIADAAGLIRRAPLSIEDLLDRIAPEGDAPAWRARLSAAAGEDAAAAILAEAAAAAQGAGNAPTQAGSEQAGGVGSRRGETGRREPRSPSRRFPGDGEDRSWTDIGPGVAAAPTAIGPARRAAPPAIGPAPRMALSAPRRVAAVGGQAWDSSKAARLRADTGLPVPRRRTPGPAATARRRMAQESTIPAAIGAARRAFLPAPRRGAAAGAPARGTPTAARLRADAGFPTASRRPPVPEATAGRRTAGYDNSGRDRGDAESAPFGAAARRGGRRPGPGRADGGEAAGGSGASDARSTPAHAGGDGAAPGGADLDQAGRDRGGEARRAARKVVAAADAAGGAERPEAAALARLRAFLAGPRAPGNSALEAADPAFQTLIDRAFAADPAGTRLLLRFYPEQAAGRLASAPRPGWRGCLRWRAHAPSSRRCWPRRGAKAKSACWP